MSYAIDPEFVPFLAAMPQLPFADYPVLRAAEADILKFAPRYEPATPVGVRDAEVPGLHDAPPVKVRVYTPSGHEGNLPGLMHIHGGGFVLGSLDLAHDTALRIASEVGTVVVSVDYRLAPEHPYPAPVEDCYAALLWTAENAEMLGIDPQRLGVHGESAGGALAAAVALMTRDRGGPQLSYQFLCNPVTDDRLTTPSMLAFDDTPVWKRPDAELSWDLYLGEGLRGTDDVSWYAAPARAESLDGLPPTCVTTCQFDPLRDEGIAYAQRLLQAGILTELHQYPGTYHGSLFHQEAAISRRMRSDEHDALRRGLGTKSEQ